MLFGNERRQSGITCLKNMNSMRRFSTLRRPGTLRNVRSLSTYQKSGQMTVELAVCLPVILAFIGILLNVMGYLNVCARFDRVAADAVRSQATSSGYGQEGSELAANRVAGVIEAVFQSNPGTGFPAEVTVSVVSVGLGGQRAVNDDGVSFSMLTRLERYERIARGLSVRLYFCSLLP